MNGSLYLGGAFIMTNEEMAVTLAAHENRIKVSENRIKDLEIEVKDIHKLTTSVEKLAISIDYQSEQLKEQSDKLDKLEKSKSNTLQYWFRLLAGAVCTGLIGYVLGVLLR
jgi:hypothetical protein